MSALGGKKDFDILVVSTPSTPPIGYVPATERCL